MLRSTERPPADRCARFGCDVATAQHPVDPRQLASAGTGINRLIAFHESVATQLGLVAILVIGFTVAGQDPYLGMGISLYGLGVLGIVLLQCIASAAIVGYFLKHRRGESIWASIIAPALGGLGLLGGLYLMITNYPTLTGSHLTWVNSLPWLLPIAAIASAPAELVAAR